jgi:hypothetical protein
MSEFSAAGPEASDRRSRLLGIKLRALVGDHLGRGLEVDAAGTFPDGAALVEAGVAWVLVDPVGKNGAGRSLGGALAWALRRGATSLELIAHTDTGMLSRRAERFSFPVRVWFAQERTLLPAMAEPLPQRSEPPAAHLELVPMIVAAGAVPNVEHGVVFGEVRGLEVCRVVDEPTVGHITDLDMDPATLAAALGSQGDGIQLEVGVGANDREAFRLLHGDIPTVDALAVVVEAVAEHRSSERSQHPLNRLGQERLLRWQLEQDPSLAGMASVRPAEPPLPRPNLKDPLPCVASGVDESGHDHVIVCSVGVDLDLVGFVADVQATTDAPVVVALRSRDAVPITRELLGLLDVPVDVRLV